MFLIFPKIESLFFLLAVLNFPGDPRKLSFPDLAEGDALGESDRGKACFFGVVGGEWEEKDDLGPRALGEVVPLAGEVEEPLGGEAPLGDDVDVRAASELLAAGGSGGGVEGAGGVAGILGVAVAGEVIGASNLGLDAGAGSVFDADAVTAVEGAAAAGVTVVAEGVASVADC